MTHNIEKTISNLVRNQFPEFYHTEGPVFVDFVTKYYEWVESSHNVANLSYADAKQNWKLNIVAGNTTITSSNIYTTFTNTFSDGEEIAIYTNTEGSNYNLYTIDSIVNNSILTLTTAPDFSITNTRYSKIKSQKNPVKFLRDFYDDIDVDSTSDEFLVYFKEKYLKGLQFDTQVDLRRIIKHALDLYRSKGTERGLKLLFKIAYNAGAELYYPGDDLFRASDGKWYIPRYLEVSLKDTNHLMINKQIYGYTSGATAFVEATVRKIVRGRLIDVLYISAINGNFQTGELVNSEDNVLAKDERPTIIGSLSSVTIDSIGAGSQFSIGDIVDIESISGEQGQARISNTTSATGIVDISLLNGGYGYTVNAEILISNSVLRLDNLNIPENYNPSTNSYFSLFSQAIQPLGTIDYSSATSEFTNNSLIYTYHANTSEAGVGRVLTASGNTSDGSLVVSIISGAIDGFATIYTTANADSATVDTYTDSTVSGNIIGSSQTANIYTTNKSGGSFVVGDYVYQTDGTTNTAVGVVQKYEIDIGANGSITVNSISGVFRGNTTIYSNTSSAQANLYTQSLYIGVIDLYNGNFITTNNNYVTFSTDANINAVVGFVSGGSGLSFDISSTLLFPETTDIYQDFIIDYQNLPLIYSAYTGTVTVNATSNVVVGAGTDFVNEIGWALTGNVSVNSTANVVVGIGTDFLNELSVNDIIDVNSQSVRIRDIVNSTFMVVNSYFVTPDTDAVPTRNPYIQITDGTEANTEAHQVLSVTDATNIEFKTTPTFAASGLTATETWGFPGNTAANTTHAVLEDIFESTSATIGKISALTQIDRGLNYDVDPFVLIYESGTYGYKKFGLNIIDITGVTGSFTEGETVVQTATGARGVVVSSNSQAILVERVRFPDANNFTVTSNSTTYVDGTESGAQANVTSINLTVDSQYIGLNAVLNSPAAFSNGAITEIDIVSSGFGFREGEVISIVSNNNIASVVANLGTQGKGLGFYRQKGGFLSDQKKLFDGLYYQDYSYEIRSSVQLSKYEEMLKQLLHVAGTKYFGAFVFNTDTAINMSVPETIIKVDNHDLLAQSIESTPTVGGSYVGFNPVDIESDTNVTAPTAGHIHVLSAAEAESVTELEQPTAGHIHVLTVSGIESNTNTTEPAIGQNHSLAAVYEIESMSDIGTSEFLSADHNLTASEIESTTNVEDTGINQ